MCSLYLAQAYEKIEETAPDRSLASDRYFSNPPTRDGYILNETYPYNDTFLSRLVTLHDIKPALPSPRQGDESVHSAFSKHT